MPGGEHHPPRHEVMALVDGEAARALGDLARSRWLRATGNGVPAPTPAEDHDPWPTWLKPDIQDASVAIARTHPAWRGQPEIAEIEALHLESIRRARRSIYLEHQYFTSPVIGEALAVRLEERDGPEVVLVSTQHSPSYFDQMTMDRTRADLLRRLWAADRYGRFRAYFPQTTAGRPIIVHSKVTIIDERLVRIGSANLNNRSSGFDTECDIAIEAQDGAVAAAISRFRANLIGHFTGAATEHAETLVRERGLAGGLDQLVRHSGGRLAPLGLVPMGPLASLIAAYHLGDPTDASDSWRPLRRRRKLALQVQRIAQTGPSSAPIKSQVDD